MVINNTHTFKDDMIDNILAENLAKFTTNANVFKHATKNTKNLNLYFNKNGLLLDDKQVLATLKKASLTEALEIIAKVKDVKLLQKISKVEKRKTVLSEIILNKFCDDALTKELLFKALQTNNRHIVENIFNTKKGAFFQNVYLENDLTSFTSNEAKGDIFTKLSAYPENFLNQSFKDTLKNLFDNHLIREVKIFDSVFMSDVSFETKISIWEEFGFYFNFSPTSLRETLKSCFLENKNVIENLKRLKAQEGSYVFYRELKNFFPEEVALLSKEDFLRTVTRLNDLNSFITSSVKENELINLKDYNFLKDTVFTDETEEKIVNEFISYHRRSEDAYETDLKEHLIKKLFEFNKDTNFFNFRGEISLLENLNDYTYAVKLFNKFDKAILFSDVSLLENLFENGADELKLLQSFSWPHLHHTADYCLTQRDKCTKYDLKFKQATIDNLFFKNFMLLGPKTYDADMLVLDLISEEQLLTILNDWEKHKILFDTIIKRSSYYIETLISRTDFSPSTRFLIEVFAYSHDIWFKATDKFEIASVNNEESLKVINSLKIDFKEGFFSRIKNYCDYSYYDDPSSHVKEWIVYVFENLPQLNCELNSAAEAYLQKLLSENFETLSMYDTFYSLLPSWEGTIKELIELSKSI